MIKKITLSFIIAFVVFVMTTECLAEMEGDIATAQKNICNIMDAGNFEASRSATDKLITDFANNPALPEAIYWTTRHCEWKDKFDEAKRLYQITLQNYPDNTFAAKAQLGISRCEAMRLVMAKEYTAAKGAADKMAVDFSKHSDLPESLGMIAERFEWQWQFEQEKYVYKKIIQNYPTNIFAEKAKIGMARAVVLNYIVIKDYERVDKGVDILFSNFAGNPDLAQTALIIGEWFEREGLAKEKSGLKDEAKIQFEKAVKVWDRVISELPDSNLIPEACYSAGNCYQKLGEYLKAAEAFSDSYQTDPEYIYADYCLFAQADCYEKAKASQPDITITSEKIKEIYREVVTKYPKSQYAFNAALRLDELQNGTK